MIGAVSVIARTREALRLFGTDVEPDPLPEMPSPTTRPRMSAEAEARLRDMVGAHFDFIWRSLRGLGVVSGSTDDAAQQVFWLAAQKLDAIAPGSEAAFLFAIARGIAANHRRSRARSREISDEDMLVARADDRPNPEQLASSNERRRLLDRFLGDLPEDLRSVFILFELEGKTTTELSELLNLPMGTVASKLRRAREQFQSAARRFQAKSGVKE